VRRGLLLVALAAVCGGLFAVGGNAEPHASTADFAVSASGPAEVRIGTCCAPAPVTYTVAFNYTGPPIAPYPDERRTRFTVRTSEHLHSVRPEFVPDGNGVTDCATTLGPSTSYGPVWTEFSCTLIFGHDRTSKTLSAAIRPSGRLGTGGITISLSTGETASVTTEFARVSEPAPPPPPPAPPRVPAIPGPAAAPTRTVTETFTRTGEAEPASAAISPTAKTAQIALTWPAGSSFDVVGVQLVPSGLQTFNVDAKRPRLAITKRRTARSLDVRIKRLQRGRLRFRIVAKRIHRRTRVTARIRQSRR
jgi:hypothetical protein